MSDPFSTFLNTSMSIRQHQSVQGTSGASSQLRESLLELLGHLSVQVEEHGAALGHRERVLTLIGRAQDEAVRSSPDLHLLRALITEVGHDVAAVSSLEAIVSALQAVLANMQA
ncbi:hypothetical protein [Streptomyces sp. NPDC101165]|uniref:hypothetical protein n=1 Tax=Streptomyces sp. NPDC101165 TaxID=3366119 RepID=UPI003809EE5B